MDQIKREAEKFIDSDRMEGMPSNSAIIKGIEANTNDRRIIRVLFDREKCKSKRAELGFLRAKLYTYSIDKLYKENQIHEEKEFEKDKWNCS